jgi:hypothetical protein
VTLDAAAYPGARCLDGSAPAYYWLAGRGAGARKWVVYLEGGGWCADVDACVRRAAFSLVGGAEQRADSMCAAGTILSGDPARNSMFADWNRVCSTFLSVGPVGRGLLWGPV